MAALLPDQLELAVVTITKKLDELGIDYAIMGGAAVCMIGMDAFRTTADIDLVIQVDQRNITADDVTRLFLKSSKEFAPVNQYGHTIPAYRLKTDQGERLVEIEVFDHKSWPNRPQYNLSTAGRSEVNMRGHKVKTFSPEWLFREKILSQHGRQGSQKEPQDIEDAMQMLMIARPEAPEMNFDTSKELEEALESFMKKMPTATVLLKQKVKCKTVLS